MKKERPAAPSYEELRYTEVVLYRISLRLYKYIKCLLPHNVASNEPSVDLNVHNVFCLNERRPKCPAPTTNRHACKSVHFHSTPSPSFQTNGEGSHVGRHLFPSRCQLDRTSFTFCLCFDTVPFGPSEQARNTKYVGEAQTAASDWQTQHEYFNNCSILDADIFVFSRRCRNIIYC